MVVKEVYKDLTIYRDGKITKRFREYLLSRYKNKVIRLRSKR